MTLTALKNLDYSINAFQIKPVNLSLKSALVSYRLHITDLAVANAVGDKLPMFVIRKAKKPRCLKNVKFLPCRYRNQ